MSSHEPLSEQEQIEAEELRQILDGAVPGTLTPIDERAAKSPEEHEFVQLAMLGKLTHLSDQEWVPRNDDSLRKEVLAMASKKAQSARVTRRSLFSRRLITWLGLFAPGALALFIALRTEAPSSEETSLAVLADSQKEESLPSAAPARRLLEESRMEEASGELPSQVALLRAQAAALAERSRLNANPQRADDALEDAWSDYRGHLIARLEQP